MTTPTSLCTTPRILTEVPLALILESLLDHQRLFSEAGSVIPFTALTIRHTLAIADASEARQKDADAMVDYLRLGTKSGTDCIFTFQDLISEKAKEAFDSAEQDHLDDLVRSLSAEARRELVGLMWIGRGDATNFGVALARAERTADSDNVEYIVEKPLHEYLRNGLRRLGLLPPHREP